MRWLLEAISKTVEQDAHASELQHADEVLDVPFPPDDQPPRVVQPGEKAFDDPPPLVSPEGATILGGRARASGPMRGDQVDAEFGAQRRIERITVVGTVADQADGIFGEKAVFERRFDEPNFMR